MSLVLVPILVQPGWLHLRARHRCCLPLRFLTHYSGM